MLPIWDTRWRIALTPLNFQLLVVPKVKCPSDRKSNKLDFLWNSYSYGHELLSVCFGLREDCKKCTHYMNQSFLRKEFEVFDSNVFAPSITIEMVNRIVGVKTLNPVLWEPTSWNKCFWSICLRFYNPFLKTNYMSSKREKKKNQSLLKTQPTVENSVLLHVCAG